MANEVVTIRINVSADTREIDKVKRKLASLSAQSAVTGGNVGDLADEIDRVGGSSRKGSRDIDTMSRSTQQFSRHTRGANTGLTGMSKVLHNFLGKLGGIGMFVMKAWVIQTALLGAGLASIAAGFKIAAAAGKLFQTSMAAVAAGAAAAVVAVTTAAAAYRQYVAATNAVNYTAGPLGNRQLEAMGAFRSIQSDAELGALGVTSVNAAFAGVSQQTAFTGDMKESLRSLADFAIASGDVEKGMASAGQFLGALRKEGKITDQVAALGEGLGAEFQTALQEAVKTGKISETDFLSALNAGSLNQKVVGLLDGVNQTLFGQAKSFMSEAISMAGDIGQTFLPDVQVAFEKMTSILRVAFLRIGADLGSFASGDFVNTIVSATQKISDFTVNLFEKYLPKADGMLTRLGDSWRDTKNWFRGLRDTFDELKKGGQILIDTFKPFFKEFTGGFGEGFKSFNKLIVDNKDKFLEFGDALGRAWDALQGLGDSLRKAFVQSLPTITRVVNLLEKLFTVLSGITTVLASNKVTSLLPLLAGFGGFAYLKSSGFRKGVNKRLGGGGGGGMAGMLPMIFGGGGRGGSRGSGASIMQRFKAGVLFGNRGIGSKNGPAGSSGLGPTLAAPLRQLRLMRQKPGMYRTPRGAAGPTLPRPGAAAAGSFAPYALMAGSLFGTEEAQIPLLAGGMLANFNPMLGAGVAGVGVAATSKTKTGGAVTGALGGAALGSMVAPVVGTIAGAVIGGISGAIMGAVNQSRDLRNAAKAIVKSLTNQTREDIKAMQVAGEKPTDIKSELKERLGYAKELKKSANIMKDKTGDIAAYTSVLEDAQMTGFGKDLKSGKISAKRYVEMQGGVVGRDYAAQLERGRKAYTSSLNMRNEALRGLKDNMPEEDYKKLRSMLNPDNFKVEAIPEINKLISNFSGDVKKLAGQFVDYEYNVQALSRATGLGADEITKKAADAGVSLWESGMNLAETIGKIGANLPATFEEAAQQFRAKAFGAIEDVFTPKIEFNEAQKAIDQLGEEVRSTRGALSPERSLEIGRDIFTQATAMFPKNSAETMRMLEGFLPGGKQYAAGGAFEGRQSQMPMAEIMQTFRKFQEADVQITAQTLARNISTMTGGKQIDVNKLQPQLMQLAPETLSALRFSAEAGGKGAQGGATATTIDQAFNQILGAGGLSGISLEFTNAANTAAATMTQGLGNAAPLVGAALYNGFSSNIPGAGQALATPLQTGSTSIGQQIGNGFGFGTSGYGMTMGSNLASTAGPQLGASVRNAIAGAPALKVEKVPAIQVNVTTKSAPADDGNPDTTSSRLASTMARHRSMNSMLAGKRSITSSLRTSNLGSLGSDHATGNAYDLVGQNLGAYQRLVQTSGGFAEFHNSGGRHLHVVPGPGVPAGDSATPAMVSAGPAMATTSNNPVYNINVNGGNASAEAIADTVMAKIAEKERSMKERS